MRRAASTTAHTRGRATLSAGALAPVEWSRFMAVGPRATHSSNDRNEARRSLPCTPPNANPLVPTPTLPPTARGPKAGSFVRPKKVTRGVALAAAIRARYEHQSAPEDAHVTLHDADFNAVDVEVVNGAKIENRVKQLDRLMEAVVAGDDVGDVPPGDLRQLVPRLKALDLSQNLVCKWATVADIGRGAPNLRSLVLKCVDGVVDFFFLACLPSSFLFCRHHAPPHFCFFLLPRRSHNRMEPVPAGKAEAWAGQAFASLRRLLICNMAITWPMVRRTAVWRCRPTHTPARTHVDRDTVLAAPTHQLPLPPPNAEHPRRGGIAGAGRAARVRGRHPIAFQVRKRTRFVALRAPTPFQRRAHGSLCSAHFDPSTPDELGGQLGTLLPQLKLLNLYGNLISSWQDVRLRARCAHYEYRGLFWPGLARRQSRALCPTPYCCPKTTAPGVPAGGAAPPGDVAAQQQPAGRLARGFARAVVPVSFLSGAWPQRDILVGDGPPPWPAGTCVATTGGACSFTFASPFLPPLSVCFNLTIAPTALTAVKELRIRNNRLGQGLRESEARKLAIVHLPSASRGQTKSDGATLSPRPSPLCSRVTAAPCISAPTDVESLNGSSVTPRERLVAERFFLEHFSSVRSAAASTQKTRSRSVRLDTLVTRCFLLPLPFPVCLAVPGVPCRRLGLGPCVLLRQTARVPGAGRPPRRPGGAHRHQHQRAPGGRWRAAP